MNNKAENLRWATAKENNADKFRHGTNAVKLDKESVAAIRYLYQTGEHTQAEIARVFNVARSTVGQIVRQEIWPLERI